MMVVDHWSLGIEKATHPMRKSPSGPCHRGHQDLKGRLAHAFWHAQGRLIAGGIELEVAVLELSTAGLRGFGVQRRTGTAWSA